LVKLWNDLQTLLDHPHGKRRIPENAEFYPCDSDEKSETLCQILQKLAAPQGGLVTKPSETYGLKYPVRVDDEVLGVIQSKIGDLATAINEARSLFETDLESAKFYHSEALELMEGLKLSQAEQSLIEKSGGRRIS
jgi:hypothetical protein